MGVGRFAGSRAQRADSLALGAAVVERTEERDPPAQAFAACRKVAGFDIEAIEVAELLGPATEPRVGGFAQQQQGDALRGFGAMLERERGEARGFVVREDRARGPRGARVPASPRDVFTRRRIMPRDLRRDVAQTAMVETFERARNPGMAQRAFGGGERGVQRRRDQMVAEGIREAAGAAGL